ncbi:hypothetical protein [Hymenobacter sp. B1770]|uniref:hypothetical protein n=1 Tax=Hymenobacter sp. B1770 TaxID=1718788 RepID=UPI003CF77BDF
MTELLPLPPRPLRGVAAGTAPILCFSRGSGKRGRVPDSARCAAAAVGRAIRVLCISEASHPSVVSSFHVADLPCFVLVHHGIELWRQCGPSAGGLMAPLLLSKLNTEGFAE